jgi:transcriptional regulator with XRE-family HTH domain
MATRQIPAFGAPLKRYRQAAGLTQEALASRAGLSTRAISDLAPYGGGSPDVTAPT